MNPQAVSKGLIQEIVRAALRSKLTNATAKVLDKITTIPGKDGTLSVQMSTKTESLTPDEDSVTQMADMLSEVLYEVLKAINVDVSISGTVTGGVCEGYGIGKIRTV